jgi:hypothetical protein
VYEEYWSVHGKIEKYEHARRRGIEAVLSRQPWWIFEKLRDEMPEYWAAHGQPIVHIERGRTRCRRLPGAIAVALALPGRARLFVAASAFLPRHRRRGSLGFLAYYVLLHVATHGYPRYRLPSLPVLFLIGAHGLVSWRAAARPAPSRGRVLAAALTAAVLALSVGPSLVQWAGLASPGSRARPRRGPPVTGGR